MSSAILDQFRYDSTVKECHRRKLVKDLLGLLENWSGVLRKMTTIVHNENEIMYNSFFTAKSV